MSDNIYDKIRSENIKKYGTDIDRYGPTLLANLYSDRTHFIYELLQNAEDACERAKKAGAVKKFIVHLQLYPDQLEMHHNGIPFDENDVRGICGLVEGTKSEDYSQIGKFGIGFKSVYAYTKSPEIYCGDKSFCIKNYVQPYSIEQREDVKDGETLFVIPFNHDKISKGVAFSEIKQRLKDIGLGTLLFLRNIEEIAWEIDSSFGKYSRSSKRENNIRWVTLTYKDNEGTKNSEKWLIFERPISNDFKNQVRVEIAYLLDKDDKADNEQIVPARNTTIVAFFPTGKPTQLKFLIQGPYQTTPARDNIYDNDRNWKLIKETAVLVAESISKIKELNLLDVSYLNTLPIEYDYSYGGNRIFKYVYEYVRNKLLSDEALLPTYNGGYTTPKQALIARGKDLRDLLSLEQLKMLFNRTKWLDENITVDKTPELRKYLMKEFWVAEIDPERFAGVFTEDFIKSQSDEWVKKFYVFLLDHEALWKEKTYSEKEGLLRSKPIIRLDNDSHTKPFHSDGKPLAYLPGEDETDFSIVKESLVKDEKSRKFLQDLGLRKPDIVDDIISNILPKYKGEKISVGREENIKYVKIITKILKNHSSDRKYKLLDELREISFLFAKNLGDFREEYKKPVDIYLGEIYTENKDLEIFFDGNDNIWLLDERYKGFVNISTFKEMGCKTEIQVSYRKPDWDGTVTIYDFHSLHRRALYEFDPDCEIEGLQYALEHINLERAKIIWNILKEHYKRILGVVEWSSRQDYSNSTKEEMFSEMGKLLNTHKWLLDKEGIFHKPSEILFSELHEEFDQESLEARHIAEKLTFKTVVEDQLLEQLPDEVKDVYKEIRSLSKENKKKAIEFIKSLKVDAERISADESPKEIRNKLEVALDSPSQGGRDSAPSRDWDGLTPEEEEKTRKEYGNEIADRLNNMQLKLKPKISSDPEFIDRINPKAFLLEQYNGHCQICNIQLDLPNKNPLFNTVHLVKIEGKHVWANMEFNVLCLCPNCQALMDHGGRDLKNILETAKKVSRGEVAPEEVDERRGDYHIINVKVAGKEREIFYTPKHMQQLAAFIEQTAEKEEVEQGTKGEEEPVLTPATAIQKGEKYEPVNDNKNLLSPLIKQAFEMAKRDDGWAYLADLGNSLRKLDPCFNHRTYGYNKLNEMVRDYEDVLGLKIRYNSPTRKIRDSNSSKRKKSVKLQMRKTREDESSPLRYERMNYISHRPK